MVECSLDCKLIKGQNCIFFLFQHSVPKQTASAYKVFGTGTKGVIANLSTVETGRGVTKIQGASAHIQVNRQQFRDYFRALSACYKYKPTTIQSSILYLLFCLFTLYENIFLKLHIN